MKYFCLIIVLVIVSLLQVLYAHAQDPAYWVCDAQAGVTKYKITWSNGVEEILDAEADGAIRRSVADVLAGTVPVDGVYAAGKPWTANGEEQEAVEWSTSVPFVFGPPSEVLSPTNTSLSLN